MAGRLGCPSWRCRLRSGGGVKALAQGGGPSPGVVAACLALVAEAAAVLILTALRNWSIQD